jgi:UPF0755 protein
MSGNGGHRSRRGRRQPDSERYRRVDEAGSNGRGEGYWDSAGYDGQSTYDVQNGYGRPAGYDEQGGYGGWSAYEDPSGYRDQAGYADRDGYGGQGGYGDQNGYGGQAGYGTQGSYGDQNGYGPGGYAEPSGYPGPGGYGEPAGYDQAGYGGSGYGEAGYGDAGGYGPDQGGRGRHSAASGHEPQQYGGGYGPGAYPESQSYGSTDPYGPGSPGPYGPADRRAIESGHSADPAGSDWQQGGYGPVDSRAAGGYETGGYGEPGYDTGSFGRSDTGSHGGWAFTRGASDGFGPGDSGSFGRPDSGSFARPDTGSYGRPDSGSFARPDTGPFYRDDDYDAGHDPGQDTGSIRWTSGPPPAKNRADQGEDDSLADFGHRPSPGDSAGYADWRDDPVDDQWDDEAAGGLLSRRFGRGAAQAPRGGGTRAGLRGRKRRRLRGKAAFAGAIVAVALFVGVAAAFGYKYVHTWITHRYGDYTGQGTGTVNITVNQGASLVALGPVLLKDGVIMALRPYDNAASAVGTASNHLQPGVYRLHHHMNSALAVKYLLSGKYRVNTKVVIIPGTRASDIAAQLAKATGFPVTDFLKIIDHPPASLGLPSWAPAKTAEGFLFPDTYTLVPKESPLQILQMMVSEFKSKIASINLVSQAATVNTTPWHVLIVASMAQAESGPGDFGKVARVAWNRLTQGVALHFDSTVFYGLHIKGNSHAAATATQIKKDTPYNTYIHTGLPPGPIGNPQLAAIQAALHPPHGPWLYFITDLKTGVTHFTASYAQFQQWQRQFQG